MKLEPHVQRVVNEKEYLDGLRDSLQSFLLSKAISNINAHHQNLLVKQSNAMKEYSKCLTLRLEDFGLRHG